MMEVPSAVIMADKLAELVDFFSVGTNDLAQYSLAIDRGNRGVAYLYQPLHPALIRMVKNVVDVGRDTDTDVCMCGEMAGDPMNIPILLGMGMKELSMNPYAIPAVKKMIRTLNINESRQFAKDVLKQSKASDIVKMVKDTYGNGNGNVA
jgi:phosphotransferase system enzyme I (PtsI)